jgi:hypothetical protein
MYSIYIITNTTDGTVYVGRTKEGRRRWKRHQLALRDMGHWNPGLQAAWSPVDPSKLEFQIIEDNLESLAEAKDAEVAWINAFPAVYNAEFRKGHKFIHRNASIKAAYERPDVKRRHREALLEAKGKPEARAKLSKSMSKPCTIDGVTIYPSRMALIKVLGHGASGMRHLNFRYV